MVKFLKQLKTVINHWIDYIFIKELHNAARYKIHKLIFNTKKYFFNKKKNYFENKLNECIVKPKDLRKALKILVLPNKISSCEVSALKVKKTVQHDTNLVLGGFKDYYSNIARNRLKKLPKPPNEFILTNIFQHYKSIIQNDFFNLATVSENTFLTFFKILKYLLDNLSGRFLKDGAKVLAKPFTDLCNLSITFRKIFWLL